MKEDKKTKEIIASLNSQDEKIALRALKNAKSHGNEAIFNVILNLVVETEHEQFKAELLQFVFDLKSSDALAPLMTAIDDDKFSAYRKDFISSFWQNPLNPVEYLSRFVYHAINEDLETTIECYSVIGEMEPPFMETEVNDSLLLLNEYLAEQPDGPQAELIRDIQNVVQGMSNSANLN